MVMTTGEEAGAIAVALHTCACEFTYNGKQVSSCNYHEALITREKNAAVEQERERCAKIADVKSLLIGTSPFYEGARTVARKIAAAIRSTSPQGGRNEG